ncbi:MAG: hypothetical protein ACE5KE_09905 [Methanosarcinales archaeon]
MSTKICDIQELYPKNAICNCINKIGLDPKIVRCICIRGENKFMAYHKNKIVLIIPTYWRRKKSEGIKESDIFYDHPTPLDEEGTLKRAIESLNILKDDFSLVILACANSVDVEEKAENKVRDIVQNIAFDKDAYLFSHSHLKKLKEFANSDLLSITGYSNIRNMCLVLSSILDAEIAILIDDDEYITDPFFISKIKEDIGRNINGKIVYGLAGYYVNQYGSYELPEENTPWSAYWNPKSEMNKAFKKIIGTEPRIKETPFVFGGNMALHRNLYTKVPYDPNINRGEDIDYLINAKIFGYTFFLDNTLSVVHDAPPKPHPPWKLMREDIIRFVYERKKVQDCKPLFPLIRPEDFDPYPGEFIKENLEEKVYKSSVLLSIDALLNGDTNGAKEFLNNISLVHKSGNLNYNIYNYLLDLQKRWENLHLSLNKEKCKEVLEKCI